ncbi:MAG: hypothetical protein V8Q93_01840 [Blautia faecis]
MSDSVQLVAEGIVLIESGQCTASGAAKISLFGLVLRFVYSGLGSGAIDLQRPA